MNEIICMTLVSIVTLIMGGIIYIGYKYGPAIVNFIASFIRWHIGKFKDDFKD